MKRLFFSVLSIVLVSLAAYASDVSDLLDKAKDAYTKGNLNETVRLIDQARKIVDKEQISQNDSNYIEISNWNIVKVKKSEYVGKKVKITTKFYNILSDGTISLKDVGGVTGNSYTDSLIDTVLSLKEYSNYTFYGKVIDDNYWGPKLYIEAIE